MITTNRALRSMQKRITWTFFHLPSTKPWPTWPSAAKPGEEQNQDSYLGAFCNVPGVENARLARKVEDVEQAAYILLWSSADAFASFQASSLFPVFLEALGSPKAAPTETIDTPSARTVSLQWDHGFDMDTKLHGRVTLNKFTGIGTWESWHEGMRKAFAGFKPLGCNDIARKRPPMRSWCITWVDQQGSEQQGMWIPANISGIQEESVSEAEKVILRGDEHVRERWEFLRWNELSYGATREREEDSTRKPGARQHWEQAVQRYMPPVHTWEQERWDIERPPHFSMMPDEDESEDDAEEDEEGLGFEIEEDDSLPVGIR